MPPPEFWQTDSLPARLLDPLGRIVGLVGTLRRAVVRPWRAPVPVICVGNLTVGGTGKTPLVLHVARRLRAGCRVPHILTRGYGGRVRGPHRVDPARDDARAVGDEALLLAAAAPTWVARDRAAGARAAVAAGAGVIVMDDGFQNPSLVQDLKLLVVDGRAGFGNGRILPAGPLREPVPAGVARADAIVIVGEDRARVAVLLPSALPRFAAALVPAADAPDLRGRRVLAFAGIGDPDKLFRSLVAAGAELVARRGFPDHHRYRAGELSELLETAERLRACPVTTSKDLVRIGPEFRGRVLAFPVDLEISDEVAFDRLIRACTGSPPITAPWRGRAAPSS